MHQFIGRVIDALGGLWVLCSLAMISRFAFKGRYWRWRSATAFPAGSSPKGAFTYLGLTLEYASWAWRIRRLR